jgi:hypothetical protein
MELLAAGADARAAYNGDLPLHMASRLGNPQARPARQGVLGLGLGVQVGRHQQGLVRTHICYVVLL